MMINVSRYKDAIQLLHQASTPKGFVASLNGSPNYQRVWTRDGVINGLASLLSRDENLIKYFRATLQTIFDHQHVTGFIPSNIDLEGTPSYGGTVGRADNASWAVIGLCNYTLKTRDRSLAEQYLHKVEKCFAVLDTWEYNGKHLIYVPQSGDWADEYFHHGYILFDQLLRVWALRNAAEVYERKDWQRKAETIVNVIQKNFWNDGSFDECYSPNLKHLMPSVSSRYWIMGFNPSRVYHQFDLQANALAILLDVGTEEQHEILLEFIVNLLNKYNSIIPSFYPAIGHDDQEMKDLSTNYAYSFRNKPDEFHNGGLWPVWNGLLVAALQKLFQYALAKDLTAKIHQANAAGEGQFNECLHGKTKQPIGVPFCYWSAGGIIIAEQSLRGNEIFF